HSRYAKEIGGHCLVHDAVRGHAPLVPLPSDSALDRDPTEEAGWVPLDLETVFRLVVCHALQKVKLQSRPRKTQVSSKRGAPGLKSYRAAKACAAKPAPFFARTL